MHSLAATVLTSKLELLTDLIDTFKKWDLSSMPNRNKAMTHFEFVLECITKNKDRLTAQEIGDIQNEIARFNRMLQLLKLAEAPSFRAAVAKKSTEQLFTDLQAVIFGIGLFTQDVDKKVRALSLALHFMCDG